MEEFIQNPDCPKINGADLDGRDARQIPRRGTLHALKFFSNEWEFSNKFQSM